MWSESDSCDLALSFQEKAGCEEIWEKICQVQGKDPSNDVTQDVGAFEADNDESDANDSRHLRRIRAGRFFVLLLLILG